MAFFFFFVEIVISCDSYKKCCSKSAQIVPHQVINSRAICNYVKCDSISSKLHLN